MEQQSLRGSKASFWLSLSLAHMTRWAAGDSPSKPPHSAATALADLNRRKLHNTLRQQQTTEVFIYSDHSHPFLNWYRWEAQLPLTFWIIWYTVFPSSKYSFVIVKWNWSLITIFIIIFFITFFLCLFVKLFLTLTKILHLRLPVMRDKDLNEWHSFLIHIIFVIYLVIHSRMWPWQRTS